MRKARVSFAAAGLLAALGFAPPSRAASITVTSEGVDHPFPSGVGVDEITILSGRFFWVEVRLDTEDAPSNGYAVEVAWDGGPEPLLTVEDPSPQRHIVESHPSAFDTATIGVGAILFRALDTPGVTTVRPVFGTGDGVLDGTGTSFLPTTLSALTVHVVPEPARGQLLAGVLAVAIRRRPLAGCGKLSGSGRSSSGG